MTPRYLVVSLGKSGSNWLNNLISGLPGIKRFNMGLHKFTGTSVAELDLLMSGSVAYTHLQRTPEFVEAIERLNIVPFYIYRDIRDSVVSEYFHKKYLDPKTFEKGTPILAEVNDETAFDLENIMRWSTCAPFYNDVPKWALNPDIASVKFEDLHRNPVESFRVLLAFNDLNYSQEELEKSIEASSFKKMSGGRQKGDENRNSHYRKGIIGDWRNHFSPQQAATFYGRFGETLSSLGYEE